MAPCLQHHLVRGANRRDVPEMRLCHIDDDPIDLLGHVDFLDEVFSRGKEDLALHEILAHAPVGGQARGYPHEPGHLPREEDAGEKHTDDHALREVTRRDHGHDGRDHHDGGLPGDGANSRNGLPGKGVDRHHDHHRRQPGDGHDRQQPV